jgi:translation elongation factor EF-1beta
MMMSLIMLKSLKILPNKKQLNQDRMENNVKDYINSFSISGYFIFTRLGY